MDLNDAQLLQWLPEDFRLSIVVSKALGATIFA